jgi:DNA-directed RNA polymerase specialized sigma24 family protein
VAKTDKEKARRRAQAAQASFERDSAAVRKARRKAFAEAQAAGLSLREIGEAVGLHYTRVGKILREK